MKSFLFSAALLLAAAPAARAQMSPDLIMETYNSNIQVITNGIINKDMMDKTVRNYNARGGSRGAAAPSRTATASRTSFTYVPTAAATQEVLKNQSAGKPAAAAQQFAAAFGPGGQADYQAMYRKALAGSGLRDNDVADAFAAYLVAGYQVAHGVGGTLLPAGPAAAVRAQFAPATGRVLAGKPAAMVAAIGEYFKLQTALLYVGSQGNSSAAYRQGVARTLNQRLHLDVTAMTLTSQGLVKK